MLNDFDIKFEKRRKLIRNFTIGIAVVVFLGIGVQIWSVYYAFNKVEENGGVQKTLTDILRVVKQIDKDSDK